MKNTNAFRIAALGLMVVSLSACSPFGNQSLIQDLTDQISVFFPGKTSTSVLPSASSTMTTPDPSNPLSGQLPYKVTHSVGDVFQQGDSNPATYVSPPSAQTTSGGYRVYSSVGGDLQ